MKSLRELESKSLLGTGIRSALKNPTYNPTYDLLPLSPPLTGRNSTNHKDLNQPTTQTQLQHHLLKRLTLP